MTHDPRHWTVRYAFAIGAVAAGVLLRLAVTAWVGPGLPTYITFYPSVLAAALAAGLGPGLLATALAALIADYWLLPLAGFGVAGLMDAVGLGLFTVMGMAISIVAGQYRRIRNHLVSMVEERTKALNDANIALQQLNAELEQRVAAQTAELRRTNETLEQRVAERTGEVQAANKSLQESQKAALNLMDDAIESRKRAEQVSADLRQERDFTTAVLDNTGAMVVVLDLEGRITRFNKACEAITGYASAEVCGRVFWEFLIPPEELQGVSQAWALLRAGDFPNQHENHWLTKSNSRRLIAWSNTVITRPEGGVKYIIGTGVDITERRQAEQELLRLNRTLKALSDSDQAMMRATDEVAYLQDVCRIIVEDCGHPMVWIGYAGQDAAKSVRPLASAGFEEGYLETLDLTWADTEQGHGPTGACIRTGRVCECRNMLTDPDFRPWREQALKRGYAASIALPLIFENAVFGALTIYFKNPDSCSKEEIQLITKLAGDLSYGIAAIRAHAARAQAEKALRETAEDLVRSNKDLEQFAHVASHDLKEPLRMVTGFMSLLNERYGGKLDAKAREYIGFATEAAARMQKMVDDLLAYSRAGRNDRIELIDITTVVDATLGNLQIGIEESGAVITHDPLPTVKGNPLGLTQVFQNLIGNAIKFRKPDTRPEIHIGARKVMGQQASVMGLSSFGKGGETSPHDSSPMPHDPMTHDPMTHDLFWLFSIRDNGIGIEPQFADRIFMIFQRLHTREEYPGSGVGLAICKKIIERHGGRIWVESKPGNGSAFCFTWPDNPKEP